MEGRCRVDSWAQEDVPSTPGWGALGELWAQALGWESDTQRSWVPEAFQERPATYPTDMVAEAR